MRKIDNTQIKRARNFQFSIRRNKQRIFLFYFVLFFFLGGGGNISINVVRRDFWGAQRWRQKKKTENKFCIFLFFIRIDCVTAFVWGPCQIFDRKEVFLKGKKKNMNDFGECCLPHSSVKCVCVIKIESNGKNHKSRRPYQWWRSRKGQKKTQIV